ncbi:MAG: beta-Ig-H3/fasciclin [Candidatus Kaiserbacteria bacterium]|nr:beta-Ig-H3/fasciclin [Candidatus Kaiserbacteria bacterium]
MNNDSNRGLWIGIVIVIVLVALGLWWYSSSMTDNSMTTDTTATTTVTTGTGAGTTGTTGTTGSGAGTSGSAAVIPVTKSSNDVVSIVSGLSGVSQFNALFHSTGVAATIVPQAGGKYTIFVPTNGAISQLPAGTISNMTAAEKKRLIQYHVVSGRAIDTTSQTAGQIQALSGDALNFNYGTNKIPMVNSSIIIAQYNGSNGTVYLVDNVLLPPKKSNI